MKFQTLDVKKVVRTMYLLPCMRKEFVTDFCKGADCKLPTILHRKKPKNLSSIKTGSSHQTLLNPLFLMRPPYCCKGSAPENRRAVGREKVHVLLSHACVPGGMEFTEDSSNKAESWMEFSLTWKSLKPFCSQSNYKKHASDCFKYPLIRRKYASFDLPK